jgi:hypothetical protein
VVPDVSKTRISSGFIVQGQTLTVETKPIYHLHPSCVWHFYWTSLSCTPVNEGFRFLRNVRGHSPIDKASDPIRPDSTEHIIFQIPNILFGNLRYYPCNGVTNGRKHGSKFVLGLYWTSWKEATLPHIQTINMALHPISFSIQLICYMQRTDAINVSI